jgi:hypothetical protein
LETLLADYLRRGLEADLGKFIRAESKASPKVVPSRHLDDY